MAKLLSIVVAVGIGCFANVQGAEPPPSIHESFDNFDAKQFLTSIPNKHTEVRNGVLWTRGSTRTAYPPIVILPVQGTDLAISFRYRHLAEGGWLWLLVDGDDGYGSVDHLFRVKLLRDGIQLQVDGHTLDPKHPLIQPRREPDPASHAYRLNEELPAEKLDLSSNAWHTVKLEFRSESVTTTFDDSTWKRTLSRPGFNAAKRKLLWLLNGGNEGIELDDIHVTATSR